MGGEDGPRLAGDILRLAVLVSYGISNLNMDNPIPTVSDQARFVLFI